MLVLTRKQNEKIIITVPPSSEPTRIEVVCVECRVGQHNKARLGIDAPRDTLVHRGEIQDAIERSRVSS